VLYGSVNMVFTHGFLDSLAFLKLMKKVTFDFGHLKSADR